MSDNNEVMHTFPEKTAAQQRYHEANERHYSNREVEMAAGAFDRAEEVAQELDDWTHLIHMRLNTMSQRLAAIESPATADPDPVCAKPGCAHCYAGNGSYVAGCPHCNPAPPAAPEPLDPVRLEEAAKAAFFNANPDGRWTLQPQEMWLVIADTVIRAYGQVTR